MAYRFALILYISVVLLFSYVHDYRFFLLATPFLFILSGKDLWRIFKKTFMSVFIFSSFVSLSYTAFSLLKNQFDFEYLLLLNLRVFSITFLTFFFFSRFNIFKLFDFSKTLTFILVLSYSQINIFRKYFQDFKFAFKSRTIIKPSKNDIYNFVISVITFFGNKSVNNAKEITQAMNSRGFFIDR